MKGLTAQVPWKGYSPPHKYWGHYQPNKKNQGLKRLDNRDLRSSGHLEFDIAPYGIPSNDQLKPL